MRPNPSIERTSQRPLRALAPPLMSNVRQLLPRPMRTRKVLWCSLAGLVWSSQGVATQVHSRSLEDVLKETQLAVVVEVQNLVDHRDSATWRSLTLSVKVNRIVFGGEIEASVLRCSYEEGQPHWRGPKAVSPLVSGSGMEFKVKVGERVLLLIAQHASAAPEACTVLRIEPEGSESLVKRKRNQSGVA